MDIDTLSISFVDSFSTPENSSENDELSYMNIVLGDILVIFCERWISLPENGFLQTLSLDGERFFKALKSKSFPGKGVLKNYLP